ncbi:hypothetical protein F511_34130 [Dorcoceras hygrometricum]|uniref:Uncharacterized protein n=1 Tax=Dorcoceras hygrometricum TaxID=472368 RepID=A0A2Z7A9B6_9LAMI|nr:hypothetical protein F511_34130 [Dorcoceras hygrometricum]
MSWSEKPTRKAPPLPAQEYDPTPFLNAVSAKCFNARDLVREDLLCHFGFSWKGVVVEGDLAGRIMKSYLLEAYRKQESEASQGSNPPTEERANPPPEEPANPTPAERTKEKEGGLIQAARETVRSSRRSLDEVMAKHDNLMKEIEEVRGVSDAEKKSLANKLAASEASVTRLQEEIKKVGEEAEEKIKKAQEEAEASWEKRKEDFLKSNEFDRLCSTRALSVFQQGFDGCLAQIRTNGYSEAEHPFSFLNVLKSLEALPDEVEVESSMAKK